MFKLKAIKLKESFKKSPKNLAEHSFLFFLAMFLIIAFFGGFIFYHYQYSLSFKTADELSGEKPLKFDVQRQQKILEEWQKRNENFNTAGSKEYSDPFYID